MISLINHDSRARSQWGRYNLPRYDSLGVPQKSHPNSPGWQLKAAGVHRQHLGNRWRSIRFWGFDPWKLMHSSREFICFTGKNMGIHHVFIDHRNGSPSKLNFISVPKHFVPIAPCAWHWLCWVQDLWMKLSGSQVMMISCWGSSLHGLLHCEAEKFWSLMVIAYWSHLQRTWWPGLCLNIHVRWAWIGCKSGLKEMEEHNIHPPKNWLCLQVASLSRGSGIQISASSLPTLCGLSNHRWKSLKLWKPKATTWHTSCNSWQNNLKASQNVKKTNSYKFQEFCVRFWVLPVPPCTPEN